MTWNRSGEWSGGAEKGCREGLQPNYQNYLGSFWKRVATIEPRKAMLPTRQHLFSRQLVESVLSDLNDVGVGVVQQLAQPNRCSGVADLAE